MGNDVFEPSMNELLRRPNPRRRALEERLIPDRDATDPRAWGGQPIVEPEYNEREVIPNAREVLEEIPKPWRRDYELADMGEWFRIFDLDELFGKERRSR